MMNVGPIDSRSSTSLRASSSVAVSAASGSWGSKSFTPVGAPVLEQQRADVLVAGQVVGLQRQCHRPPIPTGRVAEPAHRRGLATGSVGPMSPSSAGAKSNEVAVEVGGRQLKLSNLDKVLYPEAGFTKGQVIDYYTRIAPVLVPHLAGAAAHPQAVSQRRRRPVLLREELSQAPAAVGGHHAGLRRAQGRAHGLLRGRRPPHPGVDGQPGRPRAAPVAVPGARDPAADDDGVRPRPRSAGRHRSSAPGSRCCSRTCSTSSGLQSFPKTSGSKGLQIYVPLNTPVTYDETKPFAHALAKMLEAQHPEQVLSLMKKELRTGKVFIDWSQNDEHKTTVSIYSLRARPRPTVSTPVTWDEVAGAAERGDAGAPRVRGARRARAGGGARRPVRPPPHPRAAPPGAAGGLTAGR